MALGVPPQLLGIPGDNTYSNYAEAQRAFWRQTVLPLVNRTARALSLWLGSTFAPGDSPPGSRPPGAKLEFRADLDQVEAFTPEREALWARLNATSFLTDDEKRVAAGYGETEQVSPSRKYSPDQPRVPAGNSDGGQWTDGGGAGSFGSNSDGRSSNSDQSRSTNSDADRPIILAAKKGGIAKELFKLTVRQFVSQYCKGEINREIPSELSDVTLGDMIDLAKGGDARAKKCQKLLNQGRFRK